MLTARNRRFRIAALLAAAAYLIGTAGALIEANRILGQELAGSYKVSAAITLAALLIGIAGWLSAAAALGAEIDWRRLRIGGTILAFAYIATAVASVLRSIAELGDVRESHARLGYIAVAVAVVLAAAAVVTIVSGFVESRRGKPRAIRLRAGAALWVLSGLGAATAALLFQSSFAHLGGPHQLITGSTLLAIGGLGSALAALVVALAATRPLGRREAGIAGAATIAVAAILCAAGGESLVAAAYPLSGSSLWVAWLGVAVRVTLAAGLACVAAGARTAATPSSDPVSA